MVVVNGWTIYEHPEFARQRDRLKGAVEALRRKDPEGYKGAHETKLLATIAKLALEVIPADPAAKQFRQGGTLGERRKHWFRAKFGNGRYRLFFQFSSKHKVIIYAWVNDEQTLRTYGGKTDAYAVFRSMLDQGNPPDSWDDLVKAMGASTPEAMNAPSSATEKKGRRK